MLKDRKILIHVGYPKCASTFLQEHIFPQVLDVDFHHKQNNPHFYRTIFRPDINYSPVDVAMTTPAGKRKLLISLEGLVGNPLMVGLGDGATIAKRLKDIFPQAHIAIIIRNQYNAIESFILEFITGGSVGGLGVNRFFKIAQHQHFNLSFFCYSRLIGWYRGLFGWNNVHIHLYEDLLTDPKKFVKDILAPISTFPVTVFPGGPVRARVSPFGYLFLRLVNFPRYGMLNPMGFVYGDRLGRAIHRGVHILNRLYKVTPVLGKRVSLLTERNRDAIRRYYKADNKYLSGITGIALGEYGYPV